MFLRVNHAQSFRLKTKIQNSRSIQLLIYSLFSFFFADFLGILLMLQSRMKQKTGQEKIFIQTKEIAIKIVSSWG